MITPILGFDINPRHGPVLGWFFLASKSVDLEGFGKK